MDAREADLEPGQKWTGWHRIEKDLWPPRAKDYTPLTPAERPTYADDLLANTADARRARSRTLTFTVDQIANGAKGLLDEVATGKVTGEEEYWSRTDLWDFQANVDGARVAFEGLRAAARAQGRRPSTPRSRRGSPSCRRCSTQQQDGDGFVTYDKLTKAQVKELSDAVNALSEPLSKLTGAVAVMTAVRRSSRRRPGSSRRGLARSRGRWRRGRRSPGPARWPAAGQAPTPRRAAAGSTVRLPRRAPGRHHHRRPRTGCTSPPSTCITDAPATSWSRC